MNSIKLLYIMNKNVEEIKLNYIIPSKEMKEKKEKKKMK
jgi:hypothetical protein